jgi:hypothetical protein
VLTRDEVLALQLSRSEPFKSITDLELLRIIDAKPRALLLGDGPLFPLPANGTGWNLWRSSGMSIVDWLMNFGRVNLRDGQHWNEGRAHQIGDAALQTAEELCLPVVFVGSTAANCFGHYGESKSLGSRCDAAPRMRVHVERNVFNEPLRAAFRAVLEAYAFPPFEKIVDKPTCCQTLPSAHPAHPRVPYLRILCDHYVVLPWSFPSP